MPETAIILELFGLQGSLNWPIERREQSGGKYRPDAPDEFPPRQQMTGTVSFDARRR
jgi:hypothetical protein